jgi:ATP-binding cassette subfamily B protein
MALSQALLGLFTYLRHVWDSKLSMRAVFHLRGQLYDRLQHAGFSFYDKMTSGQLINRALSDLQSVRGFINVSVINILDMTVSITGYLTLLAFKSPWLALAALLPTPISLLIVMRFTKQAQPRYDAQQVSADILMHKLTEAVYGVQVIKAFGVQERESQAYAEANRGLLKRMTAMISLQAKLNPSLKAVAILSHVALFVLTSWLIQRGQMQIGDLMILGAAMGTILGKLEQVNLIADVFQKAMVSARRLFEVLDAPLEAPRLVGFDHPGQVPGDITFDRVSFGYDPSKPVLRDVSLTFAHGKMTALAGATGAGKSTLASLLARFYDPEHGRIMIAGVDIRSWHLADLRRAIGYVFQETYLFSDTIRNNILYGRTDVSTAMLRQAIQVADAADFIDRLPDGLDTRLGEYGVLLSGGQRQRLALARALVYDPGILILDDATAALDAATEAAVQDRMVPLLRGRTVVVIAHRLSTLRRADAIVMLQQGSVVQTGDHESLQCQSGPYRELIRLQSPNLVHQNDLGDAAVAPEPPRTPALATAQLEASA